jgi:hypothetical protein
MSVAENTCTLLFSNCDTKSLDVQWATVSSAFEARNNYEDGYGGGQKLIGSLTNVYKAALPPAFPFAPHQQHQLHASVSYSSSTFTTSSRLEYPNNHL